MVYLITQQWVVNLSLPVMLTIIAVCLAALVTGADWVVEGASGLAIRAGVPTVIIGATIVSLGTTGPECAVSVMAAWTGEPGLALGNAVGSIIADTAMVFGLGCVLTRLPANRYVLNRHGWIQLGCGVMLAALCYGAYALAGDHAVLGRWVGLLLLAVLAGYIVISVMWSRQLVSNETSRQHHPVIKHHAHTSDTGKRVKRRSSLYLVAVLLIGLVAVILSSRVLVGSVSELAYRWGVPQVVIASTIVAIGTSLPEMVVGLASIIKGDKEILIGNIIGADILNVLFVVGASATAADLTIVEDGERVFLYLHLPVMLAVLILFRLFMLPSIKRGYFKQWYGLPLLLIYTAYVAAQFIVTRG